MERQPAVYIMSNKPRGTLYVGVTSNIALRVHHHKQGSIEGFTKRYGLKRLVYLEACDSMRQAILREKRMKRWRRAWKIALIETMNPDWRDLSKDL